MGDYDEIKAKLDFGADIDYYETTDFALIAAEVANGAWIGTGDAMLTLSLHRSDGLVEQVHLPVQVDNGPVDRGRVTFAIENVTRQIPGETQLPRSVRMTITCPSCGRQRRRPIECLVTSLDAFVTIARIVGSRCR
jgi:hypothetical protein